MMRIWLVVGLSWLWWGCERQEQPAVFEPLAQVSPVFPSPDSAAQRGAVQRGAAQLSGEQLAYRYCQSCHTFPSPDLLPKAIWTESVLPRMGHWLGIRGSAQEPYRGMSMYDDYIVRKAGIFPDEPKMSAEAWESLVAYYKQQAPDSLVLATTEVDTTLSQFQVHLVRLQNQSLPNTTLTRFDTVTNHLWIGDARGKLYQLNQQNTILDSASLDSPPADIRIQSNESYQVLTMGIMNPSDQALGKLWQKNATDSLKPLLSDDLRRPVQFMSTGLGSNRREGWFVAEFGHFLGQLAYFERTKDNMMRKQILTDSPGTRKVEVADVDQDGLLDVTAQITQGDERIVTWFNRGNDWYQPKVLLRFPPVYGSSYFELVDFNQDGRPDILYTNGDNADYSPVFKPYHGIRIFLQQAEGSFQESYFFPMPGASKALARDFDQDGDLDIAAISFFPDFEQTPERGFLYLENQSTGTTLGFSVSTFTEAAHGHWLTMDTGDTDQDGDLDIILGSFILPPVQAPTQLRTYWAREGPNYMILENNSGK